MTSDAEYYDSDKDDEDEWGDPLPQRRTERRRLAAMVSVRFSPAEGELVRQVAAARGESVSSFIRSAALRECRALTAEATLPPLLSAGRAVDLAESGCVSTTATTDTAGTTTGRSTTR